MMTRQKSFKRRVRTRMEKTGESYTAARRQLISEPVSDEPVRERTGRSAEEWFALLDAWGAAERPHREIARWLMDEHGVPGWWAQNVTVSYERARGLRAVGQRRGGGFEATASKTVAVRVERLSEAFTDPALRERWLPDAPLEIRTARPGKSLTANWEDGTTRVIAGFDSKGESKSQVGLAHQRLPDADARDEMKAYWREALVRLKALLES